jgi:general stress protein YciG
MEQQKSKKGFASMDPEKRSAIARMGGKAAHEKGTAHQFKKGEEAQTAGRKGGKVSRRFRGDIDVTKLL